jgi:hypothetical protein
MIYVPSVAKVVLVYEYVLQVLRSTKVVLTCTCTQFQLKIQRQSEENILSSHK